MAVSVRESNPADWLKEDLQAVERCLTESAASQVELLEVTARHILEAGGKRLRPQLTLLSACSVGAGGDWARAVPRAVPLAAVMELIHTATLVHDDIVDESDSRRGRATVNHFWGNSASVIMGDYLVIRAFSLIARDGDPRLFRLVCDTIASMCEGEVIQICCRGDIDLSEEAYFTIIHHKTAVLTAACCAAGALVGGACDADADALAEFGRNLGMAFQIQDDILDLIGDRATLGKPVGSDLRERKVTLPLIHALSRAEARDRAALAEVLAGNSRVTATDVARVVEITQRTNGFEAARDRARVFLRDAVGALDPLSASRGKAGLLYLADRVVDRIS